MRGTAIDQNIVRASIAADALLAGRLAPNRATGRIALAVAAADGRTRRQSVHESGSLRVRFPTPHAGEPEAVLVNTAGGMAGGDRFDVSVAVGEGAALVVTTAAAEKVYRSLGDDASVSVALTVGAGGRLCWLPQETILFDRARLSRRIDIDLADTASVLVGEAIVFGRSAMGESVTQGRLMDRWRVRRDGRLILADGIRLDGPVAETLATPAAANGGAAIATMLVAPGDEKLTAAVRAHADEFHGEVGISAWNGLAVVRLAGRDGAALRRDLVTLLPLLRGGPLPRLWLN
jgi:urease accessory protein